MSSHHVDDLLKLHTLRGTRAYIAWIIAVVSSNTKHTFLREQRRLSNDRRLEVVRGWNEQQETFVLPLTPWLIAGCGQMRACSNHVMLEAPVVVKQCKRLPELF